MEGAELGSNDFFLFLGKGNYILDWKKKCVINESTSIVDRRRETSFHFTRDQQWPDPKHRVDKNRRGDGCPLASPSGF